jgi:hypothetical protein
MPEVATVVGYKLFLACFSFMTFRQLRYHLEVLENYGAMEWLVLLVSIRLFICV